MAGLPRLWENSEHGFPKGAGVLWQGHCHKFRSPRSWLLSVRRIAPLTQLGKLREGPPLQMGAGGTMSPWAPFVLCNVFLL